MKVNAGRSERALSTKVENTGYVWENSSSAR